MIISASRRTDIPAFYAKWFMNGVKAGYVDVANPFNPLQVRRVDLSPGSVDCIVFWTRNPVPLMRYLDDLNAMKYKFIFLYTITSYPRELEPNLPSLETAIETFIKLSSIIGPERVIWRYDPIVFCSITSDEYHLRNFETIAGKLSGHTRRVIISFVDLYKKIMLRLDRLKDEKKIEILDTRQKTAIAVASRLRRIVDSFNISIQSCAEEIDLTTTGVSPGSCIDLALINEVFDLDLGYQKDSGQRKKCLCSKSVDIGAYNTCGYRCVYCYANTSYETVDRNRSMMKNNGSSLFVGNKID